MPVQRHHFAPAVCLLAVATATGYLYFAGWTFYVCRARHGMPPGPALQVARDQWLFDGAYALLAVGYLRHRWRGWLQLAGMLSGLQVALLWLTGGTTPLPAINVPELRHADPVALLAWTGVLRLATGIACLADWMRHRRRK